MGYKKQLDKTYNVSMKLEADYGGLSWQEKGKNIDVAKKKALERFLKIAKKDLDIEREE